MLEFKESDSLSDINYNIFSKNMGFDSEFTDEIQISEEKAMEINNYMNELNMGYQESNLDISREASKGLVNIFKEIHGQISHNYFEFSEDFIILLGDYIYRESDPTITYNCAQIVSFISAQSFNDSDKLKLIIPKLSRKLRKNTYSFEKYIVSAMTNVMNLEPFHKFFDQYNMDEFNFYVDSINSNDEALYSAKFYNSYVLSFVPQELLKNILYRLPKLMNLLEDSQSEYIITILIHIIQQDGLDLDFFFQNNFISYIEEFRHLNLSRTLFFYSLCISRYPESREHLNLDKNELFQLLNEDTEQTEDRIYLVISILSVFTSDFTLCTKDFLDIFNWIDKNQETMAVIVKQECVILIMSILSRCQRDFIENIKIDLVFDILANFVESIGSLDIFEYICRCYFTFADFISTNFNELTETVNSNEFVENFAEILDENDYDVGNPVTEEFFHRFFDEKQ